MSRTFAYARVSTTEQTTQNQIEEIKTAGFDIAERHIFCDVISGSTLAAQRPQFSALLNKLDQGDTLVVSKLHISEHSDHSFRDYTIADFAIIRSLISGFSSHF